MAGVCIGPFCLIYTNYNESGFVSTKEIIRTHFGLLCLASHHLRHHGQYILNPLNLQCSKTLSLSSPSQHANQTGNNICVSFQFDDIFSFVFLRLVQYMQSQISSLCGSNSSSTAYISDNLPQG